MAKGLAKKEGWRTFVEATDTQYYEETMLQGMIIGLAKMELPRLADQIRQVMENWES